MDHCRFHLLLVGNVTTTSTCLNSSIAAADRPPILVASTLRHQSRLCAAVGVVQLGHLTPNDGTPAKEGIILQTTTELFPGVDARRTVSYDNKKVLDSAV